MKRVPVAALALLLVGLPLYLRLRRPPPEPPPPAETPDLAAARRTVLPVVRAKAKELERGFARIRSAVEEGAGLAAGALAGPVPAQTPLLHPAERVAAWVREPGSAFARESYKKKPYAVYHLAPGADRKAAEAALARLSSLAPYFHRAYAGVPLCRSVYVGHPDGFILGYPGGEPFPPSYDPRARDWYLKAERLSRRAWTDPYLDKNGRDLVITAAQPVYDEDELAAVAALDVTLTDMVRALFDLAGLPVEDAILSDEQGWVRAAAGYQASAEPDFKVRHVSELAGGLFQEALRSIASRPGEDSGLVPEDGTVFAFAKVPLDAEQSWLYLARVRKQLPNQSLGRTP